MFLSLSPRIVIVVIVLCGWSSFCLGQTPQQTPAPDAGQPGSISGVVLDQSGAVIAGARVKLTRTGPAQSQDLEALSDGDGKFSFASIAPGTFQVSIASPGFAPQTISVVLRPGETNTLPQITLTIEANVEVQVRVSQVEVAEEQIKVQEKQRVLGVLPNFYVSYIPNAAPLNSRQKFKLAAKTVVDPFTLIIVAGTAGVQQAQDHFREYGQGAEGYAKRFGAGYADTVVGTFIGGAILPSLLKQDPRYFYKGTGSTSSRFLYALASSVICKGDNRRWQVNYSNVLGSLAAGGISNLYYPDQDRNGAALTLENGAIGIGTTAVANLFQEFLIRKLTPKAKKNQPAASGN